MNKNTRCTRNQRGWVAVSIPATASVEMVPNQVMGEMVFDGGGQFIPAGIFG